MKRQLLCILILSTPVLAKPAMKKDATPIEKAFYERGQRHMNKLIELCKQKKHYEAAFEDAMVDKTMKQTYENLSAPRGSARHKIAFNNYRCHLCGMKNAIDRYKPQRRRTQDAFIIYNKKQIMFALEASDWDTILENNRQATARFMKRMQELRWEVLAELV